jgi:hypothetical protein
LAKFFGSMNESMGARLTSYKKHNNRSFLAGDAGLFCTAQSSGAIEFARRQELFSHGAADSSFLNGSGQLS